MSFIGTAVLGAGVLSAGASIYGADKAADAQTAAANQASQIAQQQYQQTRTDLSPYRQIGQTATDQMTTRLSDLTSPIVMDQATLEKTPGYQFNLTQGQKGVANSAAARGLASSGAALKGAATFATGLADSTYQQQFNNANTNQTNAYTRLKSLIDTGASAATGTAAAGTAAANTSANAAIGAGNANAAASNATGSALSNLANNMGGYAMYQGMYGSSGSSSAGRITYGNGGGPTPFSA